MKFANLIIEHQKKWKLIALLLAAIASATFRVLIITILFDYRLTLEAPYLQVGTVMFFCISVLLYRVTGKYFMRESIQVFREISYSIRLRIINQICQLPLLDFQKLYKNKSISLVMQELSRLDHIGYRFFLAILMLAYVISHTIHIVWLFPVVIWVLLPAGLAVWLIFYWSSQYMNTQKKTSENLYEQKLRYLSDIFLGIKENRVNAKKYEQVRSYYQNAVHQYHDTEAKNTLLYYYMRSIPEQFLLIIVLVIFSAVYFIYPLADRVFLFELFSSLILLLQAFGAFIGQVAGVSTIEIAIQSIERVEQQIQSKLHNSIDVQPIQKLVFQEDIKLQDISFAYPQGKAVLNDFNLLIRKGEILFITGSNGAGKSTLIKILLGLYQPTKGSIWLDQKEIGHAQLPSYQSLFSYMPTDYRLFDKLYGTKKINKKKVNFLLKFMQLPEKVSFEKDRFTNTKLSTGQKKRLALLTKFIENKDIYVLDEVAADQDPENRKRFYQEILPDMKKAGKTMIVISHDSRYFHIADRVVAL